MWRGNSLRAWSGTNTHPDTRFYGFDSFEGLPEDWAHGFGKSTPKRHFDVEGTMPSIPDARVSLIDGWFQHTLRDLISNHRLFHPIVVNNDSDLHSSTLFTLATLDPVLAPGDIIVFDEYTSPVNEYLAWEEYQRAFMRKAECIAMSNNGDQTAFLLL